MPAQSTLIASVLCWRRIPAGTSPPQLRFRPRCGVSDSATVMHGSQPSSPPAGFSIVRDRMRLPHTSPAWTSQSPYPRVRDACPQHTTLAVIEAFLQIVAESGEVCLTLVTREMSHIHRAAVIVRYTVVASFALCGSGPWWGSTMVLCFGAWGIVVT